MADIPHLSHLLLWNFLQILVLECTPNLQFPTPTHSGNKRKGIGKLKKSNDVHNNQCNINLQTIKIPKHSWKKSKTKDILTNGHKTMPSVFTSRFLIRYPCPSTMCEIIIIMSYSASGNLKGSLVVSISKAHTQTSARWRRSALFSKVTFEESTLTVYHYPHLAFVGLQNP